MRCDCDGQTAKGITESHINTEHTRFDCEGLTAKVKVRVTLIPNT